VIGVQFLVVQHMVQYSKKYCKLGLKGAYYGVIGVQIGFTALGTVQDILCRVQYWLQYITGQKIQVGGKKCLPV